MRVTASREYERWIDRLRDRKAKFRIERYFERIAGGHAIAGDYKLVRPKVIEVRFAFGPGYRVYVTQEGDELLLLLLGGDKGSQDRDIARAVEIAERWRRERE